MDFKKLSNTIYKLLIVSTILVMSNNTVLAQENSPYSRYGIGNLSSQDNIITLGMGGSNSVADNNTLVVNPYNPATYSFLKLTSLNFAIKGVSNTIKNIDSSKKTGALYFNYLNLGFAVNKKIGIALGLAPVSNARYKMTEKRNIPNVGESEINYFGGGSLQKLFIGGAYKIKDVSLGLQTGYTFGSLQTGTEEKFNDSLKTLYTNFANRIRLGGFFVQPGITYTYTFKDTTKSLIFGASYCLPQSLTGKIDSNILTSQYELGTSGTHQDTILFLENKKTKLVLPADFRVGITYKAGDYWQVGAEYRMCNWSQLKLDNKLDKNTANVSSFHIGGSITPDVNSTTSTLKRMTYRVGAYTGKEYVYLNNTILNKKAISVGASYPIRRTNFSIGQLHASLEIGKRGTTKNGLLLESFSKFNIGLTFNDRWFIKRKYD